MRFMVFIHFFPYPSDLYKHSRPKLVAPMHALDNNFKITELSIIAAVRVTAAGPN